MRGLAAGVLACLLLAGGCARTPEQPRDPRLRWAPPALTDPETVVLTSADSHARLESGRDYIVELAEPIVAVGGVVVDGGRNVVMIGGHITIPWAGRDPSPADRRGLFLQDQSGVVHVEGLLIDNSGGDLSEGLQISAPDAVVQLVNVRVEGIHARDGEDFTDNHPDVVQPWGGVRELRIHRMTGTSTYQGIFLKSDQNEIGLVYLREVNLIGLPGSRYLLWASDAGLAEVDDVWVEPAPWRSFRLVLRPEPPDRTWESVRQGVPPGGDFVDAADVGVGYRSPGYFAPATREPEAA